jgi:hypothetical protein
MWEPENPGVVNYRFVVNDAVVHPWEPMPEAGRTLTELVEFLKTCSHTRDRIGNRWDWRRLRSGGAFHDVGQPQHIISYGDRSQFWIPVPPKEEDFTWVREEDESVEVECCGQKWRVVDDYDIGTICPERGYVFVCGECGRHTRSANGKACFTVAEALARWNKWFGPRKAVG